MEGSDLPAVAVALEVGRGRSLEPVPFGRSRRSQSVPGATLSLLRDRRFVFLDLDGLDTLADIDLVASEPESDWTRLGLLSTSLRVAVGETSPPVQIPSLQPPFRYDEMGEPKKWTACRVVAQRGQAYSVNIVGVDWVRVSEQPDRLELVATDQGPLPEPVVGSLTRVSPLYTAVLPPLSLGRAASVALIVDDQGAESTIPIDVAGREASVSEPLPDRFVAGGTADVAGDGSPDVALDLVRWRDHRLLAVMDLGLAGTPVAVATGARGNRVPLVPSDTEAEVSFPSRPPAGMELVGLAATFADGRRDITVEPRSTGSPRTAGRCSSTGATRRPCSPRRCTRCCAGAWAPSQGGPAHRLGPRRARGAYGRLVGAWADEDGPRVALRDRSAVRVSRTAVHPSLRPRGTLATRQGARSSAGRPAGGLPPAPRARRQRSRRGDGLRLADYHRLHLPTARPLLDELVGEEKLVEVEVEGWRDRAFLHPEAATPRVDRGTALLSPFDPVVWHRDRARRLFGFHYRIEIYVPEAKRVHGYYVLPFLCNGALVARVDLKADRKAGALLVRAAFHEEGVEPASVAGPLRDELARLAAWLGLDYVIHGDRGTLIRALAAA